MRLLLDTHIVLWWLSDAPQLPAAVRQAVLHPEAEVFVSKASLWEMVIKAFIGKLQADIAKVAEAIPAQGFRWLGIEIAHLLELGKLSADEQHRDPFDRLLVAQSRFEPLILLTTDSQLARYGATVRVC
ncbi:MAG: type II toxin-antitoxin system VapC family toxin [Burkholderiaceae bacterium]|nr:type II toxin-antitoxin system VapC family toxin [Burkholderiaceae bacterium]